ncbi:MAG: hypothetical protein ACI97B_003321, partial [Verrucomicrobiales bacterium]
MAKGIPYVVGRSPGGDGPVSARRTKRIEIQASREAGFTCYVVVQLSGIGIMAYSMIVMPYYVTSLMTLLASVATSLIITCLPTA